MNLQAKYLDEAKKKEGITSDYKLARRLGVTPQYVSSFRADRRPFTEPVCEKLGDLLGEDGVFVYARVMMARTNNPSVHRFWSKVAAAMDAAACKSRVLAVSVICILCQLVRGACQRLQRALKQDATSPSGTHMCNTATGRCVPR